MSTNSLRSLFGLAAAWGLALEVATTTTWGQAPASGLGEGLEPIVELLSQSDDAQFQLDLLNGMSAALAGRRNVAMPAGWDRVENRLGQSPNTQVRSLAMTLSLTFGSPGAMSSLRAILTDSKALVEARRSALEALSGARDPQLQNTLIQLLADATLRGQAVRLLGGYDGDEIAQAVLKIYPTLNGSERRDALNTLAARPGSAKDLLEAVAKNVIPPSQLTAEIIRQLRNLKNAGVDELLVKVWGVARESTADKKAAIEKYRQIYRRGGSTPGDASKGREVFARVCQQCHTLFEVGGKVGPDLTGSNRGDLDYILQNMVDPNAVIPNEYRTSTLDMKDDRVLTGIVKEENAASVTVITANETLVLPRKEVKSIQQSELSMMPEELLTNLQEQEVRDLIYYLGRPGQVPLPKGTSKE